MAKFDEEIEKRLLNQVASGEVEIAASNQQPANDDFEECIDLLDPEKRKRNYDWQSDISLSEYASHVFTQSSMDVGQYFQTRDFVEVYLQDERDPAKLSSEAAKELINRTLNQKHLHHYLKFVRGKGITSVVGRVYAKAWWEREEKFGVVDQEVVVEDLDVDIDGEDLIDPDVQIPAQRAYAIDVEGKIATTDRFNYDIWDQRNVFISSEYVYSLQDKSFVTFRSEMTLGELKAAEKKNKYFNLDLVEEMRPPSQTKFKGDAAEKDAPASPFNSAMDMPYDIYERYGKFWILDPENPKIGIDNDGKPLEKAEYIEALITWAEADSKRILIGFRPTPFIAANGIPYRPILRGLCYVHFTEDGGTGDGKYVKELQIGIDDTFNVSQDRVMLATIPTLKTNKHDMDDNSTIYIEPGHNMELNDPGNVEELKISDNILGALQQIDMLTKKMQQVDAIQPPSMGDTGIASTTATAFAGAKGATGERSNYKAMTFENTFLVDLYWMIQQMTYQYATEETAEKLMGDKMFDFNPELDYFYKPLSQSIEPEYSKVAKRKDWTTLIGYISSMPPNPKTFALLNYMIGEFVKLMGDEYQNVVPMLLDEQTPIEGNGAGSLPAQNTSPISNQNMVPMSGAEQGARSSIGAF